MKTDPALSSLLLRINLEKRSVEGLGNRIRDPRSTFIEIAAAQLELDQARKRLADLRTEFEAAKEKRNALLEK